MSGIYAPDGDAEWAMMDHLIRGVLQPDTYLMSVVGGRISERYITDIQNPTFPLITVTRQGMGGDPSIDNLDNAMLNIDIWSKVGVYECEQIHLSKDPTTLRPRGVKALLHNKGFGFAEVLINLITMISKTSNLFDPDTRTFHLSSRYSVKAAARTIITNS